MTAGRLLVAYSNSANYVSTTAEYLASFARHSSWDVRYIHVTHDAEPVVDLSEYDAVLNSYCARLPIEGCVSPAWRQMLAEYQGVKALAVQDEYDFTNRLKAAIREIGFDVVLTNVPQDHVEKIYPWEDFPQTAFVTVLTGYVPDGLMNRASLRLADRPIRVGYRGRELSARYGQLAYAKHDIAQMWHDHFREDNDDIRWTEGDRLYGDAWYDWIGSCRVNLAVETGSNAFDWDGEIAAEYGRRAAAGPVDWLDFLLWVEPDEAGYDMGQISARVFEAAAMRTALVCFPGRFSGILEPDKHYIPLERDFSNIGDVLRRIEDIPALEAMVTRTWYDLIGSGGYGYHAFVQTVERALKYAAVGKNLSLRGPLTSAAYQPSVIDSPDARSFVERPTREPQSPLLFCFKHLARTEGLFRQELDRSQALLSAVMRRAQEESDSFNRQIDEARSALVIEQTRGRANGATRELSD